MAKETVLVGVDTSDASVAAAKTAWDLAKAAGDLCQLVHVTADVSRMPATLPQIDDMGRLIERVQEAARREIEEALRGHVPDRLLQSLQIRMGRAAWMLPFVIDEFDASLLVLGRKRHAGPVRWFGGSTVHHVVRTVDVPLLIVESATKGFKRVLAAVDGSHAANTVLTRAQAFAKRFGAELRVVHVIEPVPYLGEFPAPLDDAAYVKWADDHFEKIMNAPAWRDLDRVVLQGPATSAIVEAAEAWNADLIVAGTHGAGWLDRVLLGSTTQRLINRSPSSLYVVPVAAPTEAGQSAQP